MHRQPAPLVNSLDKLIQAIRAAKILSPGCGAAALFADETGIAYVLFVFLQIVFYKSDIFSHTKMSLMSRMRLGQSLRQWKPLGHNLTSFVYLKNNFVIRRNKIYR